MAPRRRFAPQLSADIERLKADLLAEGEWDYSEINSLAAKMQATDDPALIKLLIERCVPFALAAASKYAAEFGDYYADDLAGIALLGLTEGVNALAKKKEVPETVNALGYLSYHVWGALRRTHDDGISASHHTRSRHRKGYYKVGVTDDIPRSFPASGNPDVPEYGQTGIPLAVSSKPSFSIDVWDEIESACWSETEKSICRMKADDIDAKQIAKELGLTPRIVRWHLKQILFRFENPDKRQRVHGTSGFHGVTLDKSQSVYRCYVRLDNKQVPIGKASTAKDAARLRERYIIAHNITGVKRNSAEELA